MHLKWLHKLGTAIICQAVFFSYGESEASKFMYFRLLSKSTVNAFCQMDFRLLRQLFMGREIC